MESFWTEKRKYAMKKCAKEAVLYLGVFLVALFCFLLFKPHAALPARGVTIQALAWIVIVAIGGFIAYLGISKRLNRRHVIVAMLVVGFLLRLTYMLYTPASLRQHDTFSKNFDGHEAYAWTLFSTGKLPTTNKYQFYHPPLNAMVQAFMMRVMNGLVKLFGFETYATSAFGYYKPEYVDAMRYFLFSSCQILSLLYSCVTCIVLLKTLKLFDFSDKTRLFLSAFIIFFPRQIHFSGALNNDPIAYMLSMSALYFALKWWKNGKRLKDILLCALFVGLGMMSKLSSATVCLPIAGIFIWEFVVMLRKKENAMPFWKMAVQYGLFLLVCAPIGLWFQVYAKIRFDQALGHVFSNLNHKLYTGDHSWFGRYVIGDFNEYFKWIFCQPFEGHYNLFNFSLRSAIFGENSYAAGEGLAATAILFAYLASAILFAGVIWSIVLCVKKRKMGEKNVLPFAGKDLLFTLLLVLSQVVSEMYFYAKMPYGCTMDFRYIMPLILGMALTIGFTDRTLTSHGGEKATTFLSVMRIVIATFLITSALFYCVCR